MSVWPSSLPQTFDTESYGFEPTDALVRTQMEKGPPRVRRVTTQIMTGIPVRWTMDGAQLTAFREFFYGVIHYGADWFEIPLFTAEVYEPRLVRFVGPPQVAYGGFEQWKITARLEIESNLSNALPAGTPEPEDGMGSWIIADGTAPLTGTISVAPAHHVAKAVYFDIQEAFDQPCVILVGHDDDDDAYVTAAYWVAPDDTGQTGIRRIDESSVEGGQVGAGVLLALYDGPERNIKWKLVASGAAPTTGKALVAVEVATVPPDPEA